MESLNGALKPLLLVLPAMAVTSAPVYAQQEDGQSEEIVIVGTRGEPRSVLDSPVPVDIIGADKLGSVASLGGELGEVLQNLSPSFNFSRQSNTGPADSVRAAQLRGLNPDQTLVLVNGKRAHTTSIIHFEGGLASANAPFDFNTVATSSIKRIEILRDGASAQYGSDAIAGVVNIVLKEGGGEGSAFASYGAHVTDFDPQERSITDGQTLHLGGEYGFDIGDDGFIRVGIEYRNRSATARGGPGNLPFFERQTPINLATNGNVNFRPGDGDTEDLWLYYNAGFDLGNGMEFYSFGRYNDRDGEGTGFFRYPDSNDNVLAIFPNGFSPVTTNESEDFALAGGFRGQALGWDWDFSLNYGENQFDFGAMNTVNASFGVNSPTVFDFGGYERDQVTVNADLVREFDWGFADEVTVAFGAEYREESFSTSAGDPASFEDGGQGGDVGAQTGPGLSPESEVDVDRDVFGIYADLSLPVTEHITLGFAGRFEDYSDFGSAVTGKASALVRINDIIALRGAVSNSFKAPAIVQLGFENQTTSFGLGGELVTIGHVSVDNPVAIAAGAEPLTEEESVNLSAGIVLTPLSNFNVTIDVFDIDIDDRITLRNIQTPAITFFSNDLDTETTGIDIVASYKTALGGGDLDLSAAASFFETDVDNPEGRTDDEINTIENGFPDSKVILSGLWSKDWLDFNLRATRFGEVTRDFDFGGGFPDPQVYDPEWTLDTEIAINAAGWEFAVGADNLFDNYPNLSSDNNNFFGNLPFDVVSPLGFNGRFVYARTKIRF